VHDTPGLLANVCKGIALIAATLKDPPPQTDGEAQAACQSGFTGCMTSLGDSRCTSISPDCTGTVAQLEACWAATPNYAAAVAATLPACATLTLAQLQQASGAMPPAQPAACATLDSLGCGDLDLTGGE
jgi:hypothetical protein